MGQRHWILAQRRQKKLISIIAEIKSSLSWGTTSSLKEKKHAIHDLAKSIS